MTTTTLGLGAVVCYSCGNTTASRKPDGKLFVSTGGRQVKVWVRHGTLYAEIECRCGAKNERSWALLDTVQNQA